MKFLDPIVVLLKVEYVVPPSVHSRDLSENELVGPIPAILGNLSYTGKL